MDIFRDSNFITTTTEFQATSGSSFVKKLDRVDMKLSGTTSGGSQYVRGKKKLATSYRQGDNFWIYETLELPANFYSQQNGSMRLISIWNNVYFGRLGLWIDSTQKPRLQIEHKDKKTLTALWTGSARQIPTGKHQYAMHIVLGYLTELYVDGIKMASISGNNMPYSGYAANQILYFFDGANANTKPFTAVGYEIGADITPPFVPVDPCASLEFDLAVKKVARELAERDELNALALYTTAKNNANAARAVESDAISALSICRSL